MVDEKKTAYEDFREAVDDYGAHGDSHDLLTDPAALDAAKERAERKAAVSHGVDLRTAREQKGFSLDELAAKTSIDKDLLSQVESGEATLPLGQVIRLSKALSLTLEDVISRGTEAFTIVRAGAGSKASRFGKEKMEKHGYEYESLAANKKDRKMEPFVVTLYPSASDAPSSHDGQEFIYVLEGRMEALVGDTREVLEPGDAIYYDSTSSHMVRAHGDKPAKILAVLVG
ncbi:MAG: XRE family transcriptional regulator [Thermodesulfobacteriota bacterium]